MPSVIQRFDHSFGNTLAAALTFACDVVFEALLTDGFTHMFHERLPDQLGIAPAAQEMLLVPVVAQRRDEFL